MVMHAYIMRRYLWVLPTSIIFIDLLVLQLLHLTCTENSCHQEIQENKHAQLPCMCASLHGFLFVPILFDILRHVSSFLPRLPKYI